MRESEVDCGGTLSAEHGRGQGPRNVVHAFLGRTATHRGSLRGPVRAVKETRGADNAVPHMSCFRSDRRQLSPFGRPHAKRVIEVKTGHMYNNKWYGRKPVPVKFQAGFILFLLRPQIRLQLVSESVPTLQGSR